MKTLIPSYREAGRRIRHSISLGLLNELRGRARAVLHRSMAVDALASIRAEAHSRPQVLTPSRRRPNNACR